VDRGESRIAHGSGAGEVHAAALAGDLQVTFDADEPDVRQPIVAGLAADEAALERRGTIVPREYRVPGERVVQRRAGERAARAPAAVDAGIKAGPVPSA